MNEWQVVSLITLLCWLVLAVRRLGSHQFTANIVIKSILIWGAIVLVITIVVLNRGVIEASLAPIRAAMP